MDKQTPALELTFKNDNGNFTIARVTPPEGSNMKLSRAILLQLAGDGWGVEFSDENGQPTAPPVWYIQNVGEPINPGDEYITINLKKYLDETSE